MNKVILIGRLTRDPEIRYAQNENGTEVARFLAVDRRAKMDGEQSADFIGCVVFGKGAEFAESKAASQSNGGDYQNIGSNNTTSGDGFMNVPDGIDEELLFN